MFESSELQAVIFDLDGTLVETEHLKASAYADLIGQMNGRGSPEPDVIENYRTVVGATDLIVCDAMIERFSLLPYLEIGPGESPAEALHRMRMAVYRRDFGTADVLANLRYEHTIRIARAASAEGLAVGVATMSFADEARRVIEAIGLSDIVDTVVGADDVTKPKPAPDAFLLAMDRLNASPSTSLLFEDSPRGARAAAASGAMWLCVANEFSSEALRSDSELDPEWIVWDPAELPEVVKRRISG